MQFHEDNACAILVAAIHAGGSRPADTIKAVLDVLGDLRKPDSQITSLALPLGALKAGEEYAGLIVPPNGAAAYHLILLPGDNDDATWQQQLGRAKSIGGDLPDRVEQALLFRYLPDRFQQCAYWSNTAHATDDAYAWFQYFHYGHQTCNRKLIKLRGRAVRRLFI